MSNPGDSAIRPKERDTIIQALGAGVVPRIGLKHIQVGRLREIQALVRDLDRIADGGSAVRFIVGEYGAGKTFFLTLIRLMAMEKRLVTISADLAPDRRLQASGGQARNLYAESLRNLSTRNKPDGGALSNVVERFVSDANDEARKSQTAIEDVIQAKLASLRELVGGYDFAQVLSAYWHAAEAANQAGKDAALRWIRGEYSTRTEARQALGVRVVVDDASIYDHWKLLAAFVRLAGYAGLLVSLDEMVNLYKLQSGQARAANYEQILRMVNDALQGSAGGIGFLFGGTPEFLMDTRRGLYSYPALQSRLAENAYATGELVDLSGPVLRLQALTPEDLRVLLEKLRGVFAGGDPAKHLVPDEAFDAFMEHCHKRIGEAYFRTPRTVIKAFVQILSVLEQNPGTDWRMLVGAAAPEADAAPDPAPAADGDDELATIKL
ncbi:MAG: ATP-binding protein [Rhizomicrobium sp.]